MQADAFCSIGQDGSRLPGSLVCLLELFHVHRCQPRTVPLPVVLSRTHQLGRRHVDPHVRFLQPPVPRRLGALLPGRPAAGFHVQDLLADLWKCVWWHLSFGTPPYFNGLNISPPTRQPVRQRTSGRLARQPHSRLGHDAHRGMSLIRLDQSSIFWSLRADLPLSGSDECRSHFLLQRSQLSILQRRLLHLRALPLSCCPCGRTRLKPACSLPAALQPGSERFLLVRPHRQPALRCSPRGFAFRDCRDGEALLVTDLLVFCAEFNLGYIQEDPTRCVGAVVGADLGVGSSWILGDAFRTSSPRVVLVFSEHTR